MGLITPNTISFKAEISEDELRTRLAREVLEGIGGCDSEGKPHPGVAVKVLRGTGKKAGYTIEVTGPAPARIAMLPRGDEQ